MYFHRKKREGSEEIEMNHIITNLQDSVEVIKKNDDDDAL